MNVSFKRIVLALGGETVLQHPVRHEFDLIDVIEKGLPIEALTYFQNTIGFTNKAMSHILAMSESTYQRRVKAKTNLTKEETEKVIALTEVYEKGIEVFENQADLDEWLNDKIPSLQNRKPIDLLDSMMGRKQVMTVLNAILHGVYL